MVHLTDRDKFVPDVMVVCDRSKIKRDGIYGAPDLVVEVLYTLYSAEELEEMTDEEKAIVVTEFKCRMYDDLIIRLEDIFNDFF